MTVVTSSVMKKTTTVKLSKEKNYDNDADENDDVDKTVIMIMLVIFLTPGLQGVVGGLRTSAAWIFV